MRKRDRIFIAPLLAVSLLFAAAPTALAAESGEQFVFDKADLLTTEEEDELNDMANNLAENFNMNFICLLYTYPSPRDFRRSRMPSSA